jgi:hypothetical protein
MDDRIAAAAAITVMFLSVASWVSVRKLAERRRFKLRQMGRGKNDLPSA